jgi:hypothetical protein
MFSPDEDSRLRFLVERYGQDDWRLISHEMHSRSPRQCRERYKNYLSPEISTRPWAESEDTLLRQKYREMGPRWARMSGFFVGRSDVACKNRWAAICAREGHAGDRGNHGAKGKSAQARANAAGEFSIPHLLWGPGERVPTAKAEIVS